jgi:hypothetical protein
MKASDGLGMQWSACSQQSSVDPRFAKSCLDNFGDREAAPNIEIIRMRVTDNMECASAGRLGDQQTVLDEPLADSLPPPRRLDEKSVQLKVAIASRDRYSKAQNFTVPLGNPGVSCLELLSGKVDRVRMAPYRLTVAGVGERRSKLQLFQISLFDKARNPNLHVAHLLSLAGDPHHSRHVMLDERRHPYHALLLRLFLADPV